MDPPALPVAGSLAGWAPLGPGRWRATWTPDDAPVVVKVWPVPVGVDPVLRLQAQKRAAETLGSQTPRVYWRSLVGSDVVSVVRWHTGGVPSVPMAATDPRLVPLLEALDRLHQAGLVHRDLCPRNLLDVPGRGFLVLDLEEVVPIGSASDVVGSPGFIAPEVARGAPATSASDLFAVGQLFAPAGVLHTLAAADDAACRAVSTRELSPLLPLPPRAPRLTRSLSGVRALHAVPQRAAQLRQQPHGEDLLACLRSQGFGTVLPSGECRLSPTELHRWEALLRTDHSVATNRERVARGCPGLATESLLHDWTPGQTRPVAWLDTLAVAALETHDPVVLRKVRAVLCHTVCAGPGGAAWWRAVVEGALVVAVGRARAVLDHLRTTMVPDRLWAWRGHAVVLQRAGARVSLAEGLAVADALRTCTRTDDPDAPSRHQAWAGVLAMQAGNFEEAARALAASWPARTFAHERVLTATNLMLVHLHLDDPHAAEAVARAAMPMLPTGGHPFAAARLAAKLREAVYRGHPRPTPDPDLLEAIVVASPPFAVGLAVLNEAAAAWRSGDPTQGGTLAAEAAERFASVGLEGGRLLAGALAHRCGHPHWTAEADRLEAAVDGILVEGTRAWLPAVAAQVLGLLARGPNDPRAEDAQELAAESGRPLQARREVLSLAEAGAGGVLT